LTPADYDSPGHHFHEAGTDAAQCKSCHMVERVYMGNDWRTDHSFRIPRPDLAAETGAPDACTTCHTDQTPEWAAQQIAERFPDPGNRGPHFGQVLAHGQADPVAAGADLGALALDAGQPAIARATALWLLEMSGDPQAAERVAPLLEDPNPLVRAAAVGAQRAADPQERVVRLIGVLDDPVRNVRMAAASAMLGAPVLRLPGAAQRNLEVAMTEWQRAMSNRLDFPETHLQLAGTALIMRDPTAAAAAFREVVRLDRQRSDAWVMLVRIAAAVDGREAASEVLAEALDAVPDDPTLQSFRRELAP
jgi:hypothetical protein